MKLIICCTMFLSIATAAQAATTLSEFVHDGFPLECATPKRVFVDGERLQFEIRSSEDAWVYVFHIDCRGKVALLYPHDVTTATPFKRRDLVQVPRHSDRFEYVAAAPFGRDTIVTLATKQPLRLASGADGSRFDEFVKALKHHRGDVNILKGVLVEVRRNAKQDTDWGCAVLEIATTLDQD